MITFALPAGSEAIAPAKPRDSVRLLVARPAGISHHRFRNLPLEPGDLLVVNTSATLPAAVGHVHVSTWLDDGSWVVEPRLPDGPDLSRTPGEVVPLPGGYFLTLEEHYLGSPRLWRAVVTPDVPVKTYLTAFGRPIRYSYVTGSYPLAEYQTVYAAEPGSAEMPSAGRPFTTRLLTRLMARGVTIAPLTLHTGVSSPEQNEPPMPERYDVPLPTIRLVEHARLTGGRVVAVGTTVVRALESTVDDGLSGWTNLVLGPDRPAQLVTGLITGLHAPEASHLALLEAVAGTDLVKAAYEEAVRERYLWHEFGDSMLLLP
ncbi:queuosine biosynthesis protein [Lentzea sp. NBRC 105346]|uniref:S-adenosylmethionine:tRNA ribosyltransferase-isomerase n=1 Tax=Lentzea sp. NBRC 105346 TaxID=3032205 RepID=UPI0024A2B052|nr:S-adenosylmethionine:tRNA ribosyltransferase-isomerase [Lentzea sp. NBRC 105346]GLZ28427.1 queuosine biosynthesis protein [Lentzea sp. NBRC 105346]